VRQINKKITSIKWLITGGCGFIGRSLIALLRENGVSPGNIRVFDNLTVGTVNDLQSVIDYEQGKLNWSFDDTSCDLIVGDIRNYPEIMAAAEGADVIIHLAACTGVQPSVEDPQFDCETNVMGILNCLEAARQASVKKFVFASSGAPLGEVEPPIHEKVLPSPISPYGASKLAGEAYCAVYSSCFELDTVVLRFGNVYGPLSSKKGSVVARFIKQALAGETLEIYGDGSATRDYVFTRDLTEAIINSVSTNGIGGEIFQIATSSETTVEELANKLLSILEESGIDGVKLIHGSARVGDMLRNYSDTSKARKILGWEAQTKLDDGLRETVSWFLEQDK